MTQSSNPVITSAELSPDDFPEAVPFTGLGPQRYFFCPDSCTFFIEPTRNANVPEKAVEIEESLHLSLFEHISARERIIAGPDGMPVRTKKHSPTPVLVEEMKSLCSSYQQYLMGQPVKVSGVSIRPGSDEQAHLTSLLSGALVTGETSFDFKSQDGWVSLDDAALKVIVKALHRYVQAMYTALRRKHEELDSMVLIAQQDADAVVDYDYQSNWPSIEDFQ